MRTVTSFLVAALVFVGCVADSADAVQADSAQNYCGNSPVSYTFKANDGWPMGLMWKGNSGTLRCVKATSDRAPMGLKVAVMCTAGSGPMQLTVIDTLPPMWSGVRRYECAPAESIVIGVVNKYASVSNPITVWYNFAFESDHRSDQTLTLPMN